MAFMQPDQYQQLIKTQQTPRISSACIMCAIAAIFDFVNELRRSDLFRSDDGALRAIAELDDGVLLQSMRFQDECPGGFHRELMLYPLKDVWEGLIGPIPIISADLSVGRIDPRTKRPFIDHSAMFWKPSHDDLKLDLGENVRDFSTGVDR
jgi:hypothetical protein